MDIRGLHGPRPLDRGGVGDRGRVLRLDHPRPLREEAADDRLPHGRHGRRGGRRVRSRRPRQAPHRAGRGDRRRSSPRQIAVDAGIDEDVTDQVAEMLVKLADVVREEDATLIEINPLIVTQRPRGGRARLEGDDRRQRALPPPGHRRALRQVRRGPAGGDGEGEGPHLRQARRQHRHPRQRRRALHVDARRRRPGRWQARQLPRRRRRLEGRGDRRRARGDHVGRQGQGDPLQHLRRHHPLRRDRQGDHRGLAADRDHDAARRAPRRHQLRGGPGATGRSRPRATSTTRRRCSAPRSASSSCRRADGNHRRHRHEARASAG